MFPKITRHKLSTLQVNIGYKCNQHCVHCHVDAGPNRWEMMDATNLSLIPEVLKLYKLSTLDLTGGAPEMHPHFRDLVIEAKSLGVDVIDRCNLTILTEPGYEDLANFLAQNKVNITASLPCYLEDNVDKQRGKGVFERSLLGLRKLNDLGYGHQDGRLVLNLVFNPQGSNLPPPQKQLEIDYRKELMDKHRISFNNLYTITNMPIKRFAYQLKSKDQFNQYQNLLTQSHNPSNLATVMCRSLISVDWQGILYDCDFNQQLSMNMNGRLYHLKDLISYKKNLEGLPIQVGEHCYGCTAGNGSSCGGALK